MSTESTGGSTQGMRVVALTGRRIDAPNSEVARFPSDHVPAVKARIRDLLLEVAADAVVCSAACGSDLITLAVAQELGLEAHVVLPFDRDRFRETSVVDRPGNWGALFDELVGEAQEQGRLRVTTSSGETNHDAYLDVTKEILDEAVALARRTTNGHPATAPGTVTVVAVWDGEPRGPHPRDTTAFFIAEAEQRGLSVRKVRTDQL